MSDEQIDELMGKGKLPDAIKHHEKRARFHGDRVGDDIDAHTDDFDKSAEHSINADRARALKRRADAGAALRRAKEDHERSVKISRAMNPDSYHKYRFMKKEDTDMADEIDEILDEAAKDSLHPNSAPTNDPKSKPEAMASVLGALGAMPTPWVLDHAKELLTQYEKWKTNAAKGSAESNKATQNMKPSDAKGGSGPAADGAMKSLGPKPALWDATKEEVETIFGGESLTEEAQGKIAALFEAAVTMRTSLIEAELQERYETELTEAMAEFIEETTVNLDKYVEYAVDQWIAENEVAVVDTLRLENTEQFMEKLKDLFVESYIDVPEERLDVVREMSEQIVDLEAKLDEALSTKAELEANMLEAAREDVIDEVSEGLTLADSEKLKTLIENVEFDGNVESYAKKVQTVRENYFDKKTPPSTSGSVDVLNEEGSSFTSNHQVISDPFVAAAARYMNSSRG